MKILLVKPPEPKKSDNSISGHIIEHLGLGYIASMLRKNGYIAEIIDGRISGLDYDQVESKIINSDCDVVGISIPYQWSVKEVTDLIINLRKKGFKKTLFTGGHPATFYYKELLKEENQIDIVCLGEGEYSVLEVVQRIENGKNFEGIKGIAYRKDGEICFEGYRDLIENLDELPFPARDTLPELLQKAPFVSVSICGSRGCSWSSCSFCDVQSFYKLCKGRKWRGRSIVNIIDEIEMLQKKYHHDKFSFIDDDFFGPKNIRKARITELCNEIEKRNLKIEFSLLCNVRDIDEDILLRMKENGLYGLFLGVESGVQRCLDTFNKGVTVEENRESILRAKSLNLGVACGSIFVDPYSTIEEIAENVEFWESVGEMSFEKYKDMMIFEGTPLLKQLKEENKLEYCDFDYTYDKALDPKVTMLNKAVSSLNQIFMTRILPKSIMIEKKTIRIMQICELDRTRIQPIMDLSNDIHREICEKVFTKVLKKSIETIDEITELNVMDKMHDYLQVELAHYREQNQQLEQMYMDLVAENKDKLPRDSKLVKLKK